ncbi:MmcQ/YjbR family DNA-binding protein [Rhizobium terrae]|uniref:MmcQ/YjbR family DNA-binding protein n=1 Tax=Rhizobium terrae TaxID=2171756 RepID=UPI0013C3378C|nr:MmcQ/YjbR family DNA-binding protein [Rhizobium terrae]
MNTTNICCGRSVCCEAADRKGKWFAFLMDVENRHMMLGALPGAEERALRTVQALRELA